MITQAIEAPASHSQREHVIAVVARILRAEPTAIRGGDRLREDLGMDSLASLELIACLSDELDLDIELDDAMQLETVDDACSFVDRIHAEQRVGVRS
jgi:acyl carrier protein